MFELNKCSHCIENKLSQKYGKWKIAIQHERNKINIWDNLGHPYPSSVTQLRKSLLKRSYIYLIVWISRYIFLLSEKTECIFRKTMKNSIIPKVYTCSIKPLLTMHNSPCVKRGRVYMGTMPFKQDTIQEHICQRL